MKKYLNSVEEVIKAIEENKKVYGLTDNILCEYKLKDIANQKVLCCKDINNEDVIINCSLVITNNGKYYTEESEPLKFEVNRAYKTREGDKAFIFRKTDTGFKVGSEDDTYEIDLSGKNITNDCRALDIVGYWEEPKGETK